MRDRGGVATQCAIERRLSRGSKTQIGELHGTFASPATRTTKPTRSAVDIHLRTLRPAVMPARSPITRSPSRCTATPSVKILVRRNGDKRILESSSSHSANASSFKSLCRLTSAQKSPINTDLRTQTSGLRRTGSDPEFFLSGRFSPNLRTT
jgi:hypothetical protein